MSETVILRRPEVEARVGLRRSALYKRIKAGTFPAPVNLGSSSVGWIEQEVKDWIDNCISARNGAGRV